MPYLTPDTPPDETVCFTLQVPNDVTWIGIVKGAISELIKSYNFEEFGTFSPSDTALRFLQMYEEFVFSECDMSGCCYDLVEHRTTSDGAMQIRVNGGDWIPDPNDPRKTAVALPPPAFDETHTKCDAATNGKQHIMDYIGQVSSELGGLGAVLELTFAIAALIVALMFGQLEAIPLIAPLIIALIPSLVFLGQAAWDAYWDSTAEDVILCALYCTIGDDGTFNDAQFVEFLARLAGDLVPGVAADNLVTQLRAAGVVALNNMCAYGESADADCSACACGCVAGWEFIPNPTGGSMVVDGAALECTTSDVNTDGKYYVLIQRTAGCLTGCGRNNSLQTIVSGGAGQQQAYISKDNCNPDDFTFNIDDTCIWRYVIKFNEPTVIRLFFEDCAP